MEVKLSRENDQLMHGINETKRGHCWYYGRTCENDP